MEASLLLRIKRKRLGGALLIMVECEINTDLQAVGIIPRPMIWKFGMRTIDCLFDCG